MKEFSLEEITSLMMEKVAELKSRKTDGKFIAAALCDRVLYAYVGSDKGYRGADVMPEPFNPVEMTENEAKELCNKCGWYQNSKGIAFKLEVITAGLYYTMLVRSLETTIIFNKRHM